MCYNAWKLEFQVVYSSASTKEFNNLVVKEPCYSALDSVSLLFSIRIVKLSTSLSLALL